MIIVYWRRDMYIDWYWNPNWTLQYLYTVFLYMFNLAGPICIYLGFKANGNLYQKCCSLCDRKCKTICIGMAEKRLNEQANYIQMKEHD